MHTAESAILVRGLIDRLFIAETREQYCMYLEF